MYIALDWVRLAGFHCLEAHGGVRRAVERARRAFVFQSLFFVRLGVGAREGEHLIPERHGKVAALFLKVSADGDDDVDELDGIAAIRLFFDALEHLDACAGGCCVGTCAFANHICRTPAFFGSRLGRPLIGNLLQANPDGFYGYWIAIGSGYGASVFELYFIGALLQRVQLAILAHEQHDLLVAALFYQCFIERRVHAFDDEHGRIGEFLREIIVVEALVHNHVEPCHRQIGVRSWAKAHEMIGFCRKRVLEEWVDDDELGTAVARPTDLARRIRGFGPHGVAAPHHDAVGIVEVDAIEYGEHAELQNGLYHHGYQADVARRQ